MFLVVVSVALEIDLYRSVESLEKGLKTLASSTDHRKEDIEDITNFVNDISAQGVKPVRLFKYVYVLRKLSTWVNIPMRNCRKYELMELVRKIDSTTSYSDWTKYDRKVILKRFYRWINGDEEHPKYFKWLKLKEPKNKILPEELLTEEDILNLIDTARHVRDKAFISTIFESGCRIGEL